MAEPSLADKLAADVSGDADKLFTKDPNDPSKVKADSASKDTPPKRGPGRPKGSTTKKTKAAKMAVETDQIAKGLGFLLATPAIPAQFAGHEFLSSHFNVQGPALGKALAEASEDNLVLRKWLLAATQGHAVAALGMAVFGYVAPPAIYFIVENGNPVRSMLGIPDNPTQREREDVPVEEEFDFETPSPTTNGAGPVSSPDASLAHQPPPQGDNPSPPPAYPDPLT